MKSGVVEIIRKPMMDYLEPFINTMVDYYERHGKKNPMACAIFFGSVLDGVSMNFILEPNLYPLDDIKLLLKEKLR